MSNISNREIEKLYEKYNPNNIRAGDRVIVNNSTIYRARVVGLELDIKNRKVYANLRLLDTTKKVPIRVDVRDCSLATNQTLIYPGHHGGEW